MRIEKAKNQFGQEVYFIVSMSEGKVLQVAGVGNLIKHYPEDCEVLSHQLAYQRIVDLNEERMRVINYASDHSYDRTGSYEIDITDEFLNDLILYGYTVMRREEGLSISLVNSDYDVVITFSNGKYHSTKIWRDGRERAFDKAVLDSAKTELDAVLKVLADHF